MDISALCLGCMEDKGSAKTCLFCGYAEGTGSESALHLPPGTVLQNKYLLGRVLGQGGFGVTYIAWDNILKLKLAIKEYLPQQLAYRTDANRVVKVYKSTLSAEFSYGREKFLEEARTLARFNEHPNIVTVRDYFEANNTAYLVMNHHEGITLQSHLDSKGGRIPVEQALAIFMPVLDALKEVHAAGILHRDISPDNLLIDKNGRVILIDFGAARQAMGEKSKSLSVIMKAGFSPVEQYYSKGEQGPWTDIYAVAASFYKTITGTTPAESMGRLVKDDLSLPSTLGIKIDNKIEETLLKALAVKAEERYQRIEEFQKALVVSPATGQVRESYAGAKPKEPAGPVQMDKMHIEKELGQKAKAGVGETVKTPEKKPLHAQQQAGQGSKQEAPYTISRKTVKTAMLVAACGLLLLGGISLFGGGDDTADLAGLIAEESGQNVAPSVIAALDADYYIDYENGTLPIGDLPIGALVVDPSWEWEFRAGNNYSGSGAVKPVTWIVVAKDHYDGLEPHVTLLSENLIGLHTFDNSTGRGHEYDEYGYNHWGDSGTANSTRGLRPWLNSSGIHASEGFYRAFSASFKGAVLTTTVPNKEWKNGSAYSTQDRVFIPSTTELGDTAHSNTYQIGSAYPYFQGAGNAKRVARIGGETWWYWSRSPDSGFGFLVRDVAYAGESTIYNGAINAHGGVRPALNLKSEILVSEIRN